MQRCVGERPQAKQPAEPGQSVESEVFPDRRDGQCHEEEDQGSRAGPVLDQLHRIVNEVAARELAKQEYPVYQCQERKQGQQPDASLGPEQPAESIARHQ